MVSWPLVRDSDPHPTQRQGPGPVRARSELEEEERANQRRQELAVQRSELNPPDVRIRAWEKVHGLRLPSDLSHPILDVIAVGTRLTLAEVQAEQRARASRRATRVAPGTPAEVLSTSSSTHPVE
jgi:hypothetical protein